MNADFKIGGKTIETERLILRAFREGDLDFLLAGYFEFNLRSKRLREKCGFEPYRRLNMTTDLGTKVPGILKLLLNPNKKITLVFSHLETLIYQGE